MLKMKNDVNLDMFNNIIIILQKKINDILLSEKFLILLLDDHNDISLCNTPIIPHCKRDFSIKLAHQI